MSQIIQLDPKSEHSVVIHDKFVNIILENKEKQDSKIKIMVNQKLENSLDVGSGFRVEKDLKVNGNLIVLNEGDAKIHLKIEFI